MDLHSPIKMHLTSAKRFQSNVERSDDKYSPRATVLWTRETHGAVLQSKPVHIHRIPEVLEAFLLLRRDEDDNNDRKKHSNGGGIAFPFLERPKNEFLDPKISD